MNLRFKIQNSKFKIFRIPLFIFIILAADSGRRTFLRTSIPPLTA
jgi:hypothetical protein